MKVHNVQQGTEAWHALRANHFTASEAPSMLGASKYQSRTDLLTQKKTGLVPEVSPAQQALFDRGHATEAMARPLVEELIGEELFPIVGTKGNLLASMDGATMLCDTLFEHKLWGETLAAQVRAGDLEPHYYWQLEQQLLVSGAEKAIFVCSDGTRDNFVSMEYRPVPGRAEQLLAGWKQFEQDLAEFEPAEAAPMVIGKAPDELPALRIELTGMVTGSNLKAFEESALAVIGAVKTNLTTDQDFADAKKAVKWCGDVESAVAAAKKQALSQTQSIDELFRSLDRISANARETRLKVDKLVKAQELSIKIEIKQAGETALAEHIAAINKRLGSVQLPPIAADFAGAMKGKSKLDNMRDAIATELARAKIEANAIAEAIEVNLASLRELADNHRFLFGDRQQLVLKANDDLIAVIKLRISEHEAEQAKKLEAQREQIRMEELAKLKRDADEAARQAEQAKPAPVEAAPTPATVAAPEPLHTQAVELRQVASAVDQAADDGQRIKLGDINGRLGFSVSADFLGSIGFEPVGRERSAILYRAADFPRICDALVRHITNAKSCQQEAA
jgi:putative phage-type endonuclease